jgi:hypothetical protein
MLRRTIADGPNRARQINRGTEPSRPWTAVAVGVGLELELATASHGLVKVYLDLAEATAGVAGVFWPPRGCD